VAEPIEATRENFDEVSQEGTVLVDVWGPDCEPCLRIAPHVAELAEKRADELRVVKLEAPKAKRACINMGVHGLPTFLLLHDGEEVSRLSQNVISPNQLDQWLDKSLQEIEKEEVS